MQVDKWRKYKNPWVITGLVLSLIVLGGLGMFAVQVFKYARAIKAGEPDPFKQWQFAASVDRLLARRTMAATDSGRVESSGKDPMMGNPAAKIRIVEFLDFECPYSKRTAPELRSFVSRYPDDVLLVVRDFPLESLNPNSLNAALAARCVFSQGNPDMYWKYHDALFDHADKLDAERLRVYAASVGVSLADFDRCFMNRATEKEVRASLEDGKAAGVYGTPTFFFNGARIQGALDMRALETVLDKMQEKI